MISASLNAKLVEITHLEVVLIYQWRLGSCIQAKCLKRSVATFIHVNYSASFCMKNYYDHLPYVLFLVICTQKPSILHSTIKPVLSAT